MFCGEKADPRRQVWQNPGMLSTHLIVVLSVENYPLTFRNVVECQLLNSFHHKFTQPRLCRFTLVNNKGMKLDRLQTSFTGFRGQGGAITRAKGLI